MRKSVPDGPAHGADPGSTGSATAGHGSASGSAVPLLSPLVFATAIALSGRQFGTADFVDLLATQAVLAYVTVVFLWGSGELARQAGLVKRHVADLSDEPPAGLFHGIGGVTGPLALTILAAAVISVSGLLQYGPLAPLSALPLLVLYLIPILTFIWVYLRILLDIDRLGRSHMALDTFPQDRTLGLDKVGSWHRRGSVSCSSARCRSCSRAATNR